MEAWPSFLPAPTRAYSINPDTMVAANDFEAGPPLQRLRFDDQIDLVSAKWEMSEYEFAIFKQWFATKLGYGTKKFTMTIPLGGLGGEDQYECEFVADKKPYSAKYVGVNYWDVSANLFVEEFNFVSEAALDILLEEYLETGSTFISAVEKLDSFVEQNLTN